MRGVVTASEGINERQQPNVNAVVTGGYEEGSIVEIVDSVFGNSYDANDIWYKLNNGSYLWSGGVDTEVDCSKLPNQEDRDQYLICYREVRDDGKPNMDSKKVPNILYFAPLRLPANSASVRVNELKPALFVNSIMQSIMKLDASRKHVFIYIHGYQIISSLKLDLLSNFVLNYMTHKENSIAKVMFMSWPAQGSSKRKYEDDRSIEHGEHFTEKNLFESFVLLSGELAKVNRCLNLVVHSFGHQLLNGMINPDPAFAANIPGRIFENIFLMAPDVTHLTVKKGGATLDNYYEDDGIAQFHYQYSRLRNMAKNVHVFHDKYDYLLYSSTKKFDGSGYLATNPNPIAEEKDYRNLGNYGDRKIDPPQLESDFNFINVNDLVEHGDPGDLLDFPFQKIKGSSSGNKIENVWDNADYNGINALRIILNASRFPNHHRYLFTCKPVVDKVLDILNK